MRNSFIAPLSHFKQQHVSNARGASNGIAGVIIIDHHKRHCTVPGSITSCIVERQTLCLKHTHMFRNDASNSQNKPAYSQKVHASVGQQYIHEDV